MLLFDVIAYRGMVIVRLARVTQLGQRSTPRPVLQRIRDRIRCMNRETETCFPLAYLSIW